MTWLIVYSIPGMTIGEGLFQSFKQSDKLYLKILATICNVWSLSSLAWMIIILGIAAFIEMYHGYY
jgi:hypothetical protein